MGYSAERAYVVYRAAGRGSRPIEVHLVIAPAAATVADAWTRLTQIDPAVDPLSLEIETWRMPDRPSERGQRASRWRGERRPTLRDGLPAAPC